MESQQSETFVRNPPKETAEDRERKHKREGLELSRSRVTRELEGARTDVHRSALENALRYLDDELGKV